MKKIYVMLMALATAAMTVTSCAESEDYYFTATEDDAPRILNTDIPEGNGGEPSALPSITRDNNFNYEVIVTPAQYTTVTWFIDGEKVHEGNAIDMPLLAGEYNVKILATTTKGKETWRNCSLEVLALDGDPALGKDDKSRWFQIGKTKTSKVSNFGDVKAIFIGDTEITNFTNDGSAITFNVPELPEGNYKFIAQTADGSKYGCGNVKVTNEEYVDPGTRTIWEGEQEINWGASNIAINVAEEGIKVGDVILVGYALCDMPEGYHCARLATGPEWKGDVLPQFDLPGDVAAGEYKVEITSAVMDAINADGGQILVVGYGYKCKYVKIAGSAETDLWEGSQEINWGASNIALNVDELGIKVGSTITVYYSLFDMPEGYHCARLATGPEWKGDVLPQFDLPGDVPSGKFSVEITPREMDAIRADGGEILVVGYGYKATKVTMK